MLAVVAALKDEISVALRRGDFYRAEAPSPALAYRAVSYGGHHGGHRELFLLVTGWGREDASAGARWLTGQHKPEAIVAIGYSGGTNGGLRPGAIVVATEVVLLDLDGVPGEGPPIASNAGLVGAAIGGFPDSSTAVTSGRVGTTPGIVHRATEKRSLGERSGVLAVDLETWHVGDAARRAGIPFVAVRVVVDPVDDDLPAFVSRVPRGAAPATSAAALRFVAANPLRLSGVLRTARQAMQARRSIARFIEEFPASWESDRQIERIGAAGS
ncbi:MAG: hypothetical protein HY682_04480 [Chloroflexi bacterium]|nr:hypothetical protein [Chloroflexota bacterium]